MTGIAEVTKRFWCAAFYVRRSQDRDKAIAVTILQQITLSATGAVQRRAAETLKEYDGE